MRLIPYLSLLLLFSSLQAGEVTGDVSQFTEDLISGKTAEYALYGTRPVIRIPNATGDEMLRMATSGDFPDDDSISHTNFIYGSYAQICRSYYIAYRVTGDARFVGQLRQYARLMSWILEERPHLILPKEVRASSKSGDWFTMIPRQASTASIFQGILLSARLTLHMARSDRSLATDDQIAEARTFLDTVAPYLNSLVLGDGEIDAKSGLPKLATEMIDTTPYNQSFMGYAVLGLTAAALTDLQYLEGHRKHQDTIDLYTGVVRKGVESFVEFNDFTEIDGRPYLFQSYTPNDPLVSVRNPETRQREPLIVDGHPVFRYPEDYAHSQSVAWYLNLLWATDPEFGVSEDLLSAVVNTYVDHLLRGKAPLDDGTVGPPSKFISPWAMKAQPETTWTRLGRASLVYAIYQPFNPTVISALTELNDRSTKEMTGPEARQFMLYSKYLEALRKNRNLLHLQTPASSR